MWSQTKDDIETDEVWCQTAINRPVVRPGLAPLEEEEAPAPETPYEPGIEPRPRKKSRCIIS